MKENKLVVTLVVIALLILGGLAVRAWLMPVEEETASTSTTTTTQSTTMHEEYPEVPANNRYVRESAEATIDRYKDGTGVIFLGFKECPWCQQMAPLLNEAAEAEGAEIYYLDIREARNSNSPAYRELVSILSPHLAKDENGNPRISVPDVSIVKDGEIVWRHEMEATTEDERTPEAYWTDERKERAVAQFREQMKEIN